MSAACDRTNEPVIEMRALSAAAMKNPGRVVLEEVNWSVGAGEYWVLAGPQGSGKSDFLMLTAGLAAPADGTYRLFGEPMPIFEGERLATRLRLGLVFDGGQLLNHLSIAQNLALPLRYHHNLTAAEAGERVQALLDLTGLAPWADAPPGAVARNWRKRAGLARALMLQPEALLLDDPLAGLDPWHAHWWRDFLRQLAAGHRFFGGRPMTLVVTAEGLRSWKGQACHFALLDKKRFVVLGNWTEVEHASHPLARELLAPELAGA